MFNRFSLTRRFWTTVAVYWVVFALAMVIGITGLMQARDSLDRLHDDRMHAVEMLNEMMTNFYATRQEVLLAFQHDPASPLVSLHGHPVTMHLDTIRNNIKTNQQIRENLLARDMSDEEDALLKEVFGAQKKWREKLDATLSSLEIDDFSSDTMQAFLVAGRTEGSQVLSKLTDLNNYQAEQADVEAELADQRYKRAQILFVLIVLFGALPVTWFMMITLRRMSRGFEEANSTAQAIAKGDLTRQIKPDGNDEIAYLLTQVRAMQQNLRQLISRINRSSSTIVDVSNRVADGSLLLSDRTDQQAASLEETSAATEELNSTVHQNAANASEAETMASQAEEVARRGGEAVNNVVRTMDEISEASHKISDIVGIIDSIAFQTNILALNAAVEAARAGEQGRGFAVVASEVRALAQRSASAAHEVKELVDSSVEVVKSGSGQVAEAGDMMKDIVTNNERMMVLIREIAGASQEQSIGLNEINQAIALMDDMTHQNVTLVEQTTSASSALREQADELASYVAAFRLGDTLDVQAEARDKDQAGQDALESASFSSHAPRLA